MKKILINSIYLEKYKNGNLTFNQIGIENNCSVGCVRKFFHKNGIHGKFDPNLFPLNEKEIVDLYKNNISIIEISKKLRSTHRRVSKILKKNNIELRNNSESCQKFKIDTSYFEKIDTHEKAYTLGLIYSDGNILSYKNTIKIDLLSNESEIKLLNDINKDLNYNRPLTYYSYYRGSINKKTVRLAIFNKKLCQDLKNLGLVDNKTFKIEFPNIDPIFHNSFILGVFDGDGNIHRCTNKKNIGLFNFSIIGYCEFIESISDIISKNCYVNKNKIYIEKRNNHGLIGAVQWCGINNIKRIMDWIYKDSKIFLHRKRKIFYTDEEI